MADICDLAQAIIELESEAIRRSIRLTPMVVGKPGECDYCGVTSPRIVHGACARCRDGRKLDAA